MSLTNSDATRSVRHVRPDLHLRSAVIALAAPTLATAVTVLLWPYDKHVPFTFYFLAVLIATIHGRAIAGIATGLLSLFAIELIVFPRFEVPTLDLTGILSLALFVVVASVIVVLVHLRQGTEQGLRQREGTLSELMIAADREKSFANTLIATMPGIFYLYDDQGHFLRWNRDFERVSGFSPEEIARMHPLDFFLEGEKALLQSRIAEVFEKGESSVEAEFVSRDGHSRPYFFTGKRILFDEKNALVGVGLDISGRKEMETALRKSEERFRTTLDNILEGCQLLGFDWRYLYLNGAAARQNRRPNEELLGHTMLECWPGIEGTEVFQMLKRCMTERSPLHDEVEFTFPDGVKGWFDVRVQPVPEGIFVLSIDISDRKQAERLLKELNEGLERKVQERTLALAEAKVRAESADRLKSTFLATMSHELRTPMNSIIGFTGIILQGMTGPLNPEQTRQLGMIQSSARHLMALINDVLDISKIEAGELRMHPTGFDLRESVERISETVRPLADKKGLALEVVLPPAKQEMESDKRRVEQILLNLLNNAIKFTDRGSIRISLEAPVPPLPDSKDKVAPPAARIRVSDTGIGIKPEDLSKLFQPFRQLDTGLERQHEGTGLGLAICYRLSRIVGGDIQVESEWGRGSRFTVSLPLKLERART
jgi:PAS domain S-box-containing protein